MSEASSTSRHPYKTNNGLALKFQQHSDASSFMARPATSHAPAANSFLACDDHLESELWYACAGPRKALPPIGSVVAYLPQGHIEQVASYNNQELDTQIPRYNLPAVIPCTLSDIQLNADPETDEVYATLTLVPLSESCEDSLDFSDPPCSRSKTRSFTKTLTQSDTSTHGGFSVPRKAAEDCLPPLDMTPTPDENGLIPPPSQELVAKDFHGNEWKFRHIYRGQPKRHLLTTGWSVFVGQKRLVAGDAVLFLRGENGELRVGVRRAPRQQQLQPKVVTSPTMHIGVLAAAAHAATEKSRFSLIYNPRSCPSEFVISYTKYLKALKSNFSVGQRFRMDVGSEDVSDRRHTGTITGVSDYDPTTWPGSAWRSLQVNWDEPLSSERRDRVSPWEVEPFTASSTPAPAVSTRKRARAVTQPQIHGSSTAAKRNGNESKAQTARVAGSTHMGAEKMQLDEESFSAKMSWVKVEENSRTEMSVCAPSPGVDNWMRRPEPSHVPDIFRTHPSGGVQDFRGVVDYQMREAEQLRFCVKSFRENKKEEITGTALQLSSPRSGLQSFMKSTTDLNLAVSSPATTSKPPTLLWPNQQPVVLTSFETPSSASWLYRTGHADVPASSPRVPVADCTKLTMSSINPADPDNGSNSSTPKDPFWDRRFRAETECSRPAVPVQSECKIFGVPLDKPAAAVMPAQLPAHSKSVRNIDEVTAPSGVSPSPTTSAVGGGDEDKGPLRSVKSSQNVQQGPVRTFTKVHKHGSLYGRSIDVSSYDGYADLLRKVESLFDLNGELFDKKSGWQLVYTDHEDDVLLVGDDPWMEFVSCVRQLRLLAPGEASSSGKSGQFADEDVGGNGIRRSDSTSPSQGQRGDDV